MEIRFRTINSFIFAKAWNYPIRRNIWQDGTYIQYSHKEKSWVMRGENVSEILYKLSDDDMISSDWYMYIKPEIELRATKDNIRIKKRLQKLQNNPINNN